MHTQRNTAGVLEDIKMPVQAKLAALWASFMFLYVYVDILSFYKPGVIDDILAGRVWQLEITQTWAVGALALMAIPIVMIFLSLTLPARANRMTNIIVASLYIVPVVGAASFLAGLLRHALQPVAVRLPPLAVACRHVVVVFAQPHRPVDEFPDDIGVAGVPVCLGDHVHQDLMQRHIGPLVRPPWHPTGGVQGQGVDGGVRVRPRPVIQGDDLLA
jgi:hypothetical protein